MSVKRGSREKSALLPTEIRVRDSRSCSRPLPSSQESWLTAGTWFEQLGIVGVVLLERVGMARVTQLICRSRSAIDCSIRRAVVSAFSPIASVSVDLVPR